MEIVHVRHRLNLDGHPDRDRINNARETCHRAAAIYPLTSILAALPHFNSRDIDDTRELPYINDLLEMACWDKGNDYIVLWTNLDACLVELAYVIIGEKLSQHQCCYSRRVDVDDATKPISQISEYAVHGGTDLFAFRPDWWRRNRHKMPDMFIACEGFDFILRHLMLRDNPNAEIKPPIVYHERHQPFWCDGENLKHNPAQVHNRTVAVKWCKENGMEHALLGDESDFLFRNDGDF